MAGPRIARGPGRSFFRRLTVDILDNRGMSFKDLFSQGAESYARYRPRYPDQLFTWLADNVSPGEVAADLGTGNGQVASALAPHFAAVVGLDPSAEQLANALPHPRVTYRCASAEATGLDDGSVDLLVAGQAFHWFDQGRFFDEVRRVVRPGGMLAIWCYGLTTITPEVDGVIAHLYADVVGPFWEPERRLVETAYREVAVPFAELKAPAFQMRARWGLEQLQGYLATWSAFKRCLKVNGTGPLDLVFAQLPAAWGDAPERGVTWPLGVRAFRI